MEQASDFLIPTYSQLGARGLDLAFKDIKDPELRASLLADPDLHDHILSSILDLHRHNPRSKGPQGVTRQCLEVIQTVPMDSILLQLGCVGCSETLARLSLKDFDTIEAANIPRDVLKTSLMFRKLSLDGAPKAIPSHADLKADGCTTLLVWLTTLPEDIGNLVLLRLDILSDKIKVADIDQRKQLCESVLAHMATEGPGA